MIWRRFYNNYIPASFYLQANKCNNDIKEINKIKKLLYLSIGLSSTNLLFIIFDKIK